MALKDIIKMSNTKKSAEDMEDIIKENIDKYRELIAYWRVYPDRLVDYYLSLGNPYNFHFFYYQRLCKKVLYLVTSIATNS